MSLDPAILFWLAARNHAALNSIQKEVNRHFVGLLPGLNANEAFVVTLNRVVRTPGCILTLGREGDVQILGSQVSRIQCQIQLNQTTREILIRDTSTLQNTRVVDFTNPEGLFFSKSEGVPRQVVIRAGDTIHLSMGGDDQDLFQFEVVWPIRDHEMQREMEKSKTAFAARPKHPHNEVTPYTTPLPASRQPSRIQTPGSGKTWLHRKLHCLGAGTFGDVYKTLNMHTGEYFAVKVMRRTEPSSMDIEWKKSILQEVRILETLSYRQVTEYYHSQGFGIGHRPVEIFMGLYKGSLEYLIEEDPARRWQQVFLLSVFQQMLRALMYIASVGILHRDVKPANILYTIENSASSEPTVNAVVNENFRFVLADFGLSKEQVQARTLQRGTPLFMAPEMRIPGAQQTYKVDIYSLGVSMLVVGDAGNIYSQPVQREEDIHSRLQHALQDERFPLITPLLYSNPGERPSAQDLFLNLWPGDEEAQRMKPKPLPFPTDTVQKEAFIAGNELGKHISPFGLFQNNTPAGNSSEI